MTVDQCWRLLFFITLALSPFVLGAAFLTDSVQKINGKNRGEETISRETVEGNVTDVWTEMIPDENGPIFESHIHVYTKHGDKTFVVRARNKPHMLAQNTPMTPVLVVTTYATTPAGVRRIVNRELKPVEYRKRRKI